MTQELLAGFEDRPSPPLGKITYEEFLEWADEDTYAEWVDGEVILLSPPGFVHQDLATFLNSLLRMFAESRRLGTVIAAPFQMRLDAPRSGREPDVIFVSNEHLHRFKKVYLDGPADLVVEIVSPDSVTRDRIEKYREYETAGVTEYWILDPERQRIELDYLDNGKYVELPIVDGVIRSRAMEGLWLKVEWLWQNPLPPLLDILKEWELV
jgi:Uma2 family endonuclease